MLWKQSRPKVPAVVVMEHLMDRHERHDGSGDGDDDGYHPMVAMVATERPTSRRLQPS